MRSIWNGRISFGLVSIPVKLYSGSEERRIDLDMLDRRDKARIRYKRVNELTGEEVAWEDIVKGFKKDDDYVVLENEDFEAANVKKSKTIEIEEFVPKDDVAEVLFKKPYFLEPRQEGEKSYSLLHTALAESDKLGVATFVMRQKEHLCLVGVYKSAIVLHLTRFQDEIRDPADLKIPEVKVARKEVKLAKELIDQYSAEFELGKYRDIYNEQLMKLIESKSTGKVHKLETVEQAPTPAEDLMAKLKASLEARNKKKAS